MSRLRITLTTAGLLLALAALTFNSLAQQPPGGGGGGRGGRGGGPGGGFGGPGGPGGGFGGPGGGSLLQLASNPAVQADMKVTEKQKTQIKSLNDKYNARMQEFRGQMGGPGGPGQGGGPQGQGQGRGRNGNGGNGQNGQGGGFGGGQVQVPDAQGGNGGGGGGGGNRGNRGNRNQNGQGIPEDPEVAQQRAEQREMMREAMTELRQSAETSLGRILDKSQATRLKQIQLQLEGPNAVLREDMMEKLGIDEAQVEMIREVQGENRNLQRETRRSRGEIMKTAFARINPPSNNVQDGAEDANGGAAANNGNGNNGRNGGGRGGRGNFDPEAMRKVMEAPEVKAQMEQIQGQEQKLTTQFAAAVNKVLTPRQRAMYKKMLGPPFDRSQMMGPGGPWGGRGGFGPGGNQATAKGAAAAKAKAKASDDDGDDETPKAKATTAAPAKAKATATRAKTLREQRGEAPSDDN